MIVIPIIWVIVIVLPHPYIRFIYNCFYNAHFLRNQIHHIAQRASFWVGMFFFNFDKFKTTSERKIIKEVGVVTNDIHLDERTIVIGSSYFFGKWD